MNSLLYDILAVQSNSKHYTEISKLILRYVLKLPKESYRLVTDNYSNIYITRGVKNNTYPCIVAHLDTVHAIKPDYKVYYHNDTYFAFDGKEQTGVGGDDKCGLYVALRLLLDTNIPIKIALFRDEEIGRLGSTYSAKNCKIWYDNCRYLIECDRRGSSDLVTKSGGIEMCNKPFLDALSPYTNKYGFKEQSGLCTDVDALLSNGIERCALNVSSGYYNPHSSKEIVNKKELNNTYFFVKEIITNITNQYEYKPKIIARSYSNNTSNIPYNYGNYSSISRSNKTVSYKTSNFIPHNETNVETFSYKSRECIIHNVYPNFLFLPDKSTFFNINTKEYIAPTAANIHLLAGLFQSMLVKEKHQFFVYSRILNKWLNKQNCIYSTVKLSYITT